MGLVCRADEGLRRRFTALVDPLRFPEDGISEADVVEVRRIKARVDDERLPRGADRQTHLKLGRGGLADVEWTVQLLQMRHAGRVEALRTPQTLPALEAAAAAGLVGEDDARTLAEAWRLVSENEGGLPVDVTVVEELGADGFVYGTSDVEGTPSNVIVRVSARDSIHKGDTIYVTTDPQSVHVFDNETGERLSE